MPIYLVRWQDLSITLVRAGSEAELMDRLDEIADPGAAKWWPYFGPLWFDLAPVIRFDVPEDAKPGELRAESIALEGLEDVDPDAGASQFLTTGDEGGETRVEMLRAVMARAFPTLTAALETFPDFGGEDEEDDEQKLRAYLDDVARARGPS